MSEIYRKDFRVSTEECDMFQACKMSCLMQYMQIMATEHATILGCGRETLMANHNCFWMLVRAWASLKKPVRFNSRLTLETWPRPVKGATVYRDYDIFCDDEYIGEATASWVMANYSSRKITPPKKIPEIMAMGAGEPSRLKTMRLQKFRLPDNMELLEEYKVRYSDTDINGHMNNVKYADVACDALDMHARNNSFVSEMFVDYVMECRAGERINVFRGSDDAYDYISGADNEGNERFIVKIKLSGF